MNDAQKERNIVDAAQRLGADIQKIILAVKMGTQRSQRNFVKKNSRAWKERLLEVLGGIEHTTTNNTEADVVARTSIKSNVKTLLKNSDCEKCVLRCMESELPHNLIHCLRLQKVLELQHAHARLSRKIEGGHNSGVVAKPMSKLATIQDQTITLFVVH